MYKLIALMAITQFSPTVNTIHFYNTNITLSNIILTIQFLQLINHVTIHISTDYSYSNLNCKGHKIKINNLRLLVVYNVYDWSEINK